MPSSPAAEIMGAQKPSPHIMRQKSYVRLGESREINCSLNKSVWRVQVYDAAGSDPMGAHLRVGDVIYFHDPDSRMTLHLLDPYVIVSVAVNGSVLPVPDRRKPGICASSVCTSVNALAGDS